MMPVPNVAEIKMMPCPFCGGPPVLISKWMKDGRWVNMPAPLPSDDGEFVEAWIFCHECGADGPRGEGICCERSDIEEVAQQAVANWNRRDERHRGLYEASEAQGHCRYPRGAEPG